MSGARSLTGEVGVVMGAVQDVRVPAEYTGTVPAALFLLAVASLLGYLGVVLWGRRWFRAMRGPRGHLKGSLLALVPAVLLAGGVLAVSELDERAARSQWSAFESDVETAYASGTLAATDAPSYVPPQSVWPGLTLVTIVLAAVVCLVVVTVLVGGARWYASTADPQGAVRTFALVAAGGLGVVILLGGGVRVMTEQVEDSAMAVYDAQVALFELTRPDVSS